MMVEEKLAMEDPYPIGGLKMVCVEELLKLKKKKKREEEKKICEI